MNSRLNVIMYVNFELEDGPEKNYPEGNTDVRKGRWEI